MKGPLSPSRSGRRNVGETTFTKWSLANWDHWLICPPSEFILRPAEPAGRDPINSHLSAINNHLLQNITWQTPACWPSNFGAIQIPEFQEVFLYSNMHCICTPTCIVFSKFGENCLPHIQCCLVYQGDTTLQGILVLPGTNYSLNEVWRKLIKQCFKLVLKNN